MNATPEKYTCANTIPEEKKRTTSFPLAELKSVYLRLPSKKAALAQRTYTERMTSKPKACKFTDEIKATVDKLLANNYSPEQIDRRCKLEGRPYVSYECIYPYI
jgi:hypothetical protein